MKIKYLKNWIDNLPNEFGDYNLVFRKIEEIDSENFGALDINIVSCGIDIGNGEAYFVDDKSDKIIERG